MMDQALVNILLTDLYKTSTATTFTPGTGGTAFNITLPYRVHFMKGTVGTNTTPGTELAAGGGYTAGLNASGGFSLGSVFAGTVSAGAFTNANGVSWSVTSGFDSSAITAIEIYDSAATAVRHMFGALTSNITGVTAGDTVSFAAGSISVNAGSW